MKVQIAGKSQYVEANGLRHHLLTYGNAGAPAVFMLPGITSPAATADFLAIRIAALGFTVYVPDIRGRGQTEIAPPGGYRLSDYAADVHGLIRALGLHKPVIIGHSMGARIAAAYATTYAMEDHGLLVLVDPPVCGPGRGGYPTSLESFMTQLKEAKAGTTLDEVRRFYPKWPERELQLRIEVLPQCDETAVRESHAGFETENFFPYWERITQPAVLIYGGNSPVVTREGAADLARANPTIRLYCVREAGHMIPWDNEAGFFQTLEPILADAKS
ncbi:alpha/beta fold hydrolase [Limibacillus halophilus]|uniref:N-formylmaleamate deformylase n=1 Tax=Limibacillus halophilus TaxID=1579333 RepID=A0A839SS10_9PROT|nr:alpha/beta hydrolase [Limibacillus halophilus]MBB3064500.1 N-formylmaleamate deformylase [Limibacillus halophilus]